jgi:hypothetical protein
MQEELFVFKGITPNKSYISTIFNFDVSRLEYLTGLDISKYVIALSQYLIYFKFQYNSTKMHLNDRQRLLDASIMQLLTPSYLKQYKTKAEAKFHLVHNTETLMQIQLELDTLQDELFLLQGMDKTISELIASFKRELTRRENELYQEKHS